MGKNKKRWICFSLLSIMMLLCALPGRAAKAASDDVIEKESRYVTTNPDERKEDVFAEKIEEDGKTYLRGAVVNEIISEEPIKEKQTVYLRKKSKVIRQGRDYDPPVTVSKEGVTYTLLEASKKEKTIRQGYTQRISGYSLYDTQAAGKGAPVFKRIAAKDPVSGKRVYVNCKKKNVVKTADVWTDTHIDVTFVVYDADHFIWNGIIVKKNAKNPLKGYEKQLLESAGGNEDNYRIRKISWKGKSYRNKHGVLCRNAVAQVQKKAPRWRVNYSAVRKVKAVKGTVYTSIYTGTKEVETGETKYTVLAKTVYRAEKEDAPLGVFLTVGILLVILAVVGFLFILFHNRKGEKKDG